MKKKRAPIGTNHNVAMMPTGAVVTCRHSILQCQQQSRPCVVAEEGEHLIAAGPNAAKAVNHDSGACQRTDRFDS